MPVPRARLAEARLQLLFTPALVPDGREPLDVLRAVLPYVDLVQVRIKDDQRPGGPAPARVLAEWTRAVLAEAGDVPVVVNDRVDVAHALFAEGCAGVHLGQDDLDPVRARAVLGDAAWIGLSTHDAAQVLAAGELPVDSLGFGPIFATATKGYTRGLGPEAAWIASEATDLPLFPIGGIGPENADQLDRVGRAAVSSALLSAPEPGRAAATLRALLDS